MATTARSVLIANAITDIGRKGQSITLTTQFDHVTEDMSTKHPLLKHATLSGDVASGRNYITIRSDYRSRENLKLAGVGLTWCEPEIFDTLTNTNGTALIYTVKKEDSKIYLLPTPSADIAYVFTYTRIHPKAGKTLTFTSGGTYSTKVDDIVIGDDSAAYGTVTDVIVTSGTWAGGDAAGTIIIVSDSGVFQAENIHVGSNPNVATIAGAAASADNYLHRFGPEFDSVVQAGLAAKARFLVKEPDWKDWENKYNEDLDKKALQKLRIYT
jgi:hypothetical protein